MAETIYDVIVVGAGVEGCGTAYQLSKRGVRVLLLEQFPLPHGRGSSHGASRIIRKAYPQQIYTEMMNYSMEEWKRIEKETGVNIYKNTGFMSIGNLSDKNLQNYMNSMKMNNAPYEALTPEKFRERFPYLRFDDDIGAVHDLQGGILYADKCLQLLQKLYIKNGGVLKDAEKVEKILPGETVSVVTTKQTYTGRSLILCCGAWTGKILKNLDLELPLMPMKINVCYWSEKIPGAYSSRNNMCFSEDMKKSVCQPFHSYGLPSEEYPGLYKLCLHGGPEVDPEKRDATDSQWTISLLKVHVRKHFPGLIPEPSIVESCMYTVTPDDNFILDRHPKWKNIAIGAGFSGHGFKHAPAVGNILADLALGKQPEYDLSLFRISRFDRPQKSKL